MIFFDSALGAVDLPDVPRRLVAECPRFAQFFTEWGWSLDPARYEWSFADYREWPPFSFSRVPEFWARRVDVRLFGPGGHIYFRAGSLHWLSETKWTWFKEDVLNRDDFLVAAAQLGTMCGASFGLVSPDSGSEDQILDLLEQGKSISEAADLLRRGGTPLAPVTMGSAYPVTPPPYYFSVRQA